VIETTDTGDSSENNLLEMFHNNITSENPMDRIFVITKANALLNQYISENYHIEKLDMKLIRGIYKKKTEISGYMMRKGANMDMKKFRRSIHLLSLSSQKNMEVGLEEKSKANDPRKSKSMNYQEKKDWFGLQEKIKKPNG